MKKEDLLMRLPIIRFVGIIQLLFILLFISSIFILIWNGWDLSWRVGVTGIIGTLLSYLIHSAFIRIASNEYDKIFQKKECNENKPLNKFQARLNEIKNKKQ